MDGFINVYRAENRKGDMKLTQSELNVILEDKHISLFFINCDLDGLWFSSAKLFNSTFEHCTLNRTDFGDADLSLTTFRTCIGYETHFDGANMYRTNIDRCTFIYSSFTRCNLTGSRVERSKISSSCFACSYVDMVCDSETDFNASSFEYSRTENPLFLAKAKNFYYPMSCPEEGEFIGWKKCTFRPSGIHCLRTCIVKLLIPEDAKRSSSTGRKCRCDKAVVLEIQDCKKGSRLPDDTVAMSYRDQAFTYKVGETVSVDNFDGCRWNECAPGIHFFIDRQEAVDY